MGGLVRILVLDGGGIRGLLTAQVLVRLAAAIGRQGQEFAETFHMIAGTSTGGIMAAGLCAPGSRKHAPADLVALYRDQGPEIFDRSFLGGLLNPVGALDETYSADALEGILRQRLGDAPLSQAGPELLVPAYDIGRACPKFFKSWRARQHPSQEFLLRDVARATSAAPTYFEPALIYDLNEDPKIARQDRAYTLVDGGVFANNPSMCALSEARRIYPVPGNRVLIVSLGTGGRQEAIAYRQARSWGKIGWATKIVDVLMDGVADSVDYQLATLADDRLLSWHRIQIELGAGGPKDAKQPLLADEEGRKITFQMDDVRPATLAALVELGNQAFEKFAARNGGADLDRLVKDLTAPKADAFDVLGYDPDAQSPLDRFDIAG